MTEEQETLIQPLRRNAAKLNAICEPLPDAVPAYELLSGGLIYDDEIPKDVDAEVSYGLRPLWYHRKRLILGETDSLWDEYWDTCYTLFPNWNGFLESRRKPTPTILDIISKGEERFAREIEEIISEVDQGP
ncbi:MAG: hypothetical protein AAF558_06025 [Verrucomicrobiota bacterium]